MAGPAARETNGLGRAIRELRLTRKLSQQRCAELIGRSRHWWVNVELGHTSPTMRDLKAIAELFRVEVDALTGRPHGKLEAVDRRQFTKGVAAIAVVGVQLNRPGFDLAGAERITGDQLAQWYTVAPAQLAPPVLGHLASLQQRLPGPARVLSLTGRTALLAGRLHIKLDQLGDAFSALALAGALADDADDAPLRALVLAARAGMYSAIARGPRPGDARRALLLADAAVNASTPEMSGRLRAAALGRRAEEHAHAGHRRLALRDLEAAEKALTEPDDGGMYYGARNVAELSAIRGSVELLIDEPEQAIATLDTTLAGMDPALIQWKAAAMADQGAAYARAGDLDAAVDRLERALQLARLAGDHVGRVAGVRERDLAGREREPAVRRLDEALAAG